MILENKNFSPSTMLSIDKRAFDQHPNTEMKQVEWEKTRLKIKVCQH